MTTRESARQHAERIEQLAEQAQRERDPHQAAQLIRDMQQETNRLSEDMARLRSEEAARATP